MAHVRAFWEEHVSAHGAHNTGPDAAVVGAIRAAWESVQNGHEPREAAAQAVRATDAWKAAHTAVVHRLYESITGREADQDTARALFNILDHDEIARRILQAHSKASGSADSVALHCQDDAAGPGLDPCRDDKVSRETQTASFVDTRWMAAFAKAYGRDPFVHEYVYVMPMEADLVDLAATHDRTCAQLMDVHRRFLDEDLSEGDIVKRYVPALYHGESLADDVKREALRRPEYRDAMSKRIGSLHLVMCGRELSDEESAYLFDHQIKGCELPLDTDDLNGVLIQFVSEGEAIRKRVSDIIQTYLAREADDDEITPWVFAWRTDAAGTEARLRVRMIENREFHAVLADTLRADSGGSNKPRDIFAAVDRALLDPDMRTVESRYDVDEVLRRHQSRTPAADAP